MIRIDKLHSDTEQIPSVQEVGSKALSLIKASQLGYSVPDGYILPAAFFAPWLEAVQESPIWIQLTPDDNFQSADALKSLCNTLTFSPEQQETLKSLMAGLADSSLVHISECKSFAVRSSSPDEDLEGASFAGIYNSELGVARNRIQEAVKSCFLSLFDERVFMYKSSRGMDYQHPSIAVIIQAQVASDVSGVAFSLNPVTNHYDESVINANFGLGDTVVDGSVSSDQYIVDQVLKTVIEKKAGIRKESHFIHSDGSVIQKKSSDTAAFCLSYQQILEIDSLVCKIEQDFGLPVDVEWAYQNDQLYVLQVRPVTGYVVLPPKMVTKPGEPRRLYLDGLLTEQGLTKSFCPVNTGVMRSATAGMMKHMGIDEDFFDATTVFDAGRMYMNIGNSIKLSGKKAFVKPIVSVDRQAAAILEQMDVKPYIPAKLPKGMISGAFKAALGSVGSVRATLKALRHPQDYLHGFLAATQKLDRDLLSEYHKDQTLESLNRKVGDLVGIWMAKISLPTLMAVTIARSGVKKLFKKEDQEVRDRLIFLERALPHNVTIEMGLKLFELSQYSEIKESADSKAFITKLNQGELSQSFMDHWNRFMSDYGFRGPRELDIATRRYYEKPEEVYALLKSMSINDHPELSPKRIFEEGVKKREESYRFLAEFLSKKGGRKLKRFEKKYKVMKCFVAYREIHKYYWIKGVDYLRRKMLTISDQWVSSGRLDHRDDIFDLSWEQAVEAEGNSAMDLRQLISENRSYYHKYRNSPNPPVIIDSRGFIPVFHQEPIGDNCFAGTAVSPGTVSGPVKVLHRSDEKVILPGDILVAIATDPGWTSLFINAAGVIIQHGGILQHGASVARESCKPCVVGIDNITEKLKDGQIVELNGSTGLIQILE